MFCPQCGKKLPDEAKFCLKCGKEIHQELLQEDDALTETNEDARNTYLSPESPVGADKPLQCPRCGNKNCQPHYLQNVNGGGYNCLTGGLGFLLAGPFGLLCGLCGRSTHINTTNTLKWVCPNCGLEFRGHQDIYDGIAIAEKMCFGFVIAFMALADICAVFGSRIFHIGFLLFAIIFAPYFVLLVHLVHRNAVKKECFVITDDEKKQLVATRVKLSIVIAVLLAIFIFLIMK